MMMFLNIKTLVRKKFLSIYLRKKFGSRGSKREHEILPFHKICQKNNRFGVIKLRNFQV